MKVMSGIGTIQQGGSVYLGNLAKQGPGALKSTRERQERQQKTEQQIQFWEQQKENLKNRECGSVEEIAKKLEQFHEYEDAIAATKKAYNMEQMSHVMDEAQEKGEKIAEAAKKQAPKTEEERKKEAEEEAMEAVTGEEPSDGILSEMMEQLDENTEELEKCLEDIEDMANTENIDKAEDLENMENIRVLEKMQEESQKGAFGKYADSLRHIDAKV